MKWKRDGDQLCITKDDFIDLQKSPAAFIPLDSEQAQGIMRDGFRSLSTEELLVLYEKLRERAAIPCKE